MGEWTSLHVVEECRVAGKQRTFGTALVWVVNYVAKNPFPRKFTYASCPERLDNGRICRKSRELGPKCDHIISSQPAYRFHLILQDAVHGGVPPMRCQMWETGAMFLGLSPQDFSLCTEVEQLSYVSSMTQTTPLVEVDLSVRDFEVKVQFIRFSDGRPSIPLPLTLKACLTPDSSMHTSSASASTSQRPKRGSTKKILVDGLQDLIRKMNVNNLDSDNDE